AAVQSSMFSLAMPMSVAAIPAETIEQVVVSSARPASSQISEGARAIAKKLGHASSGGFESAFKGSNPTQQEAERLIRNILGDSTSTVAGNKVTNVFNAAGQGVRIENGTNKFIGFLE